MLALQDIPHDLSEYNSKPHDRNGDNEVNPTQSIPGFPTYEQYKRLESNYLTSLHPNKRQKALINQALFDRIWDIFTQPRSRSETPQFRFWVRKTFTLSRPPIQPRSGSSDEQQQQQQQPEADAEQRPVLLHDNRPVAIQEQIYSIICYCHARAEHGGRDKTRAIVRELYSWVPKELVSQFVKACPTCTIKRCGNSELAAIVEQHMHMGGQHPVSSVVVTDLATELVLPTQLPSVVVSPELADQHEEQQQQQQPVVDWPPGGGPADYYLKRSFSKISGSLPDSPPQGTHHIPEAPPMLRGAGSRPMTREVSLYNGLPNGWQYDIQETGKHRNTTGGGGGDAPSGDPRRTKRPRIPSVLLPFNDTDPKTPLFCDENEEHAPVLSLPSFAQVLADGLLHDDDDDDDGHGSSSTATFPPVHTPHSSLPQSLHRFQVFVPTRIEAPHTPQIDPVLLPAAAGTRERRHANHQFHHHPADQNHNNHNQNSFPSTTQKLAREEGTQPDASPPLRSFQSFQHLVDWKSASPSPSPGGGYFEDDGPQSPFSPRLPATSTTTASSRFSTFRVSIAPPVATGDEASWSGEGQTKTCVDYENHFRQ